MSALEALDPPICHRDLKPSNVFLNVGDRCCIADMNLARRLTDESFANLTGETGTYLYMSPEMMRHDVRHPCPHLAARCCAGSAGLAVMSVLCTAVPCSEP